MDSMPRFDLIRQRKDNAPTRWTNPVPISREGEVGTRFIVRIQHNDLAQRSKRDVFSMCLANNQSVEEKKFPDDRATRKRVALIRIASLTPCEYNLLYRRL